VEDGEKMMITFWIVATEPDINKAQKFFVSKICADEHCLTLNERHSQNGDLFQVWEFEARRKIGFKE